MALRPFDIDDETGVFGDDGWEAVEEERCERRTRRRRRSGSEACDVDRGPRRRDRDLSPQPWLGGVGYGGLGAALLAIVLVVLAASYFSRTWDGPGAIAERPAAVVEQDRFADRDRDFGYAYADYARRYNTGAAWSDVRAEPDARPWFSEPRAWMGGGILLLLVVIALAAILSRSMFADPADD